MQLMETGQLKILEPAQPAPDTCDEEQPPQPIPDTCVEEVTKEIGRRNGKKDAKEIGTAVDELVEVANGD